MASANPLDDILSSSVDESVISELVGSLESQLTSPTDKDKGHQLLESALQGNHANSNAQLSDSNPLVNSPHNQTDFTNSIQNVHKSASPSNNILRSTLQPQILGISSIVGSTANVVVVNTTGAQQQHSSGNVQTSAGGLGVSGVSLLNPNGLPGSRNSNLVQNVTAQPLTAIPNIQPQSILTSVNNTGQKSNHVNTSNGPGTVTGGSGSGTSVNAMYDLASIAAEQKPLAVPMTRSDSPSQIRIIKSEPMLISRTSPLTTTNSPKPQFIIKQDASGNSIHGQQIIVKQDASMSFAKDTTSIVKTMKTNVLSSAASAGGTQTVTVVRPVAPSSQGGMSSVQVISAPRAGTTAQARSLAPRLIQNSVRLATSSPQTRMIAPSQGMNTNTPNTIRLPPGFQLPPGAVFMKNDQGQLIMVTPPQGVRNQQVAQNTAGRATVRIPMNASSTGQPTSTATQIHTINRQTTPVNTVKVVQAQPQVVASPTIVGIRPQVKVESKHVMPTQQHLSTDAPYALENVTKCRNFLSTLIKLAAKQPKETVVKVKNLIQNLVDGNLEPEKFTTELQDALSSSPQPYLVPFLRKSLPYLRQALFKNEFTIEGVRPPPPSALSKVTVSQPTSAASNISAASQLQVMSQLQQLKNTGKKPSPELLRQLHAIHQQKRGLTVKSEGNTVTQRFTPQQLQLLQQAQQIRKQQQQHGTTNKLSVNAVPSTVNALQARISAAKPTTATTGHKEKRKFESLKDDDDINDVATMGGVNLTEESRNILATANADFIGSQTRSCKDENFLHSGPLMQRVSFIAKKHGLNDAPQDVINLISHATQERLRHLTERLSTVTEHRLEIYKADSRFEVSEDVKTQLKFLEELDKLEKKRHQEQEREMLLRAAKSRSKHEDPEQLKLKQKAKELQQAEMEEVRQRQANLTALNAIGPRKKRKLEATETGQGGSSMLGTAGSSTNRALLRPRIKRVNLRDLLFIMEQEKETCKSSLFYKLLMK